MEQSHPMVAARLARISSGLTERENLLGREIDIARDLFLELPEYVRVEQQISNWIIHVAFYTDIQDTGFVQSAKRSIEDTWHLRSARTISAYSFISPTSLLITFTDRRNHRDTEAA